LLCFALLCFALLCFALLCCAALRCKGPQMAQAGGVGLAQTLPELGLKRPCRRRTICGEGHCDSRVRSPLGALG
jgi:hypothetical protein